MYDSTGSILLIAEGSNIADDRPRPLEGMDLEDHSRGSIGYDDPFIGPVELPLGDYYLAIFHEYQQPEAIYEQFNVEAAMDPLLRLEPNPAYLRIAEDHIETTGGGTLDAPRFSVLIDQDSFIPYHLGNVVTFAHASGTLYTIDPHTGAQVTRAPLSSEGGLTGKTSGAIDELDVLDTVVAADPASIRLPAVGQSGPAPSTETHRPDPDAKSNLELRSFETVGTTPASSWNGGPGTYVTIDEVTGK
ncbi:MAG: hypothetical protein GY917_24855, partial [Planctomycetaceae bacterium]|nr:hypothetical protein [Planctomycetaceae bacterium]